MPPIVVAPLKEALPVDNSTRTVRAGSVCPSAVPE